MELIFIKTDLLSITYGHSLLIIMTALMFSLSWPIVRALSHSALKRKIETHGKILFLVQFHSKQKTARTQALLRILAILLQFMVFIMIILDDSGFLLIIPAIGFVIVSEARQTFEHNTGLSETGFVSFGSYIGWDSIQSWWLNQNGTIEVELSQKGSINYGRNYAGPKELGPFRVTWNFGSHNPRAVAFLRKQEHLADREVRKDYAL